MADADMSDGGSPPGSPPGSPDSEGSRSPMREGSVSPAHSGSSGRERSVSPNHSAASGSPMHEGSVSPAHSNHSRGSGSPGSRAGSASPANSGEPGTPQSHRSISPVHSRASGSPERERSVSPARSAGSREGSASPQHSGRSRSATPEGSRSGSPGSQRSAGSPALSREGSVSPRRSRSVSPARSKSRSRSRSGSRIPASNRSRSGSRSPARSEASGSHKSRSGSPIAGSPIAGSPVVGSPKKEGHESDSDDSIIGRKKKAKLSDDDGLSDMEGGEPVTATVDDLFGDADDISSDEEDKKVESDKEDKGDEEEASGSTQRPVIEGSDEENQQPEEQPETRIEVEIPRIKTDLGKAVHYVKLPNFLSVETRPFDSLTYEDEIDEDDVLDEEGRTRMKLKVENTIRWRALKDEEGNDVKDAFDKTVKESNGRVVRWSDGSMSLHLGEEIFDIHTMPIQGDFNHLFIRQGTGLQGQSIFKTKLSFRPHSTESFTHRKMTLSLADRSTKKQKVKILPISGHDPESQRTEMIKKEEERLRASVKRESQKQRVRERAHAKGLSHGYLEGYDDEEEEEGVSLSAIKNKYKTSGKRDRPNIYSSDSEEGGYDSEREDTGAKRLMKAKKVISDDEDSDTAAMPKKKIARVVESDEEGEGVEEGEKSGEGEAMDTGGGGSNAGSDSD